jgi:hypothetical protein
MRGTIRPVAALRTILVLAFLQLALPAGADAQSAWLPFKGEASVSLTFQSLDYRGHFVPDGTKQEGVLPSRAQISVVELEYALTDRLALNASLPYIASKYTGSLQDPIYLEIHDRYDEYRRINPAAAPSLDTGDYNATFQDFVFLVRYNVLERGLTVTPVIGATVPSHDYRTTGEAAPGVNRRALHTGVNVGRLLDPLAPNAYVHAHFSYSFVQPYRGIRLDHSGVELEAGYAIVPTVTVRALADWMKTHGGISFAEVENDLALFLEHDRLLPSRHWRVAGGATVTLTDTLDLDAALLGYLSGAFTRYGLGVNVGLTWRFLEPRLPSASTRSAADRPMSLPAQRRSISATRSR